MISFTKFAETIESRLSGHSSEGQRTRRLTTQVHLYGGEIVELPMSAQEYEFEDSYLQSYIQQFGLDLKSKRHLLQTAEILAKRNAWVEILKNTFEKLSQVEIQLLVTGKNEGIAIDYAILTSGFSHPWILNKIDQLKNESHPGGNSYLDPDEAKKFIERRQGIFSQDPNNPFYQEHIASHNLAMRKLEMQKEHIGYWIKDFDLENKKFKSSKEAIAYDCEIDIERANIKINELKAQIQEQGKIIGAAKLQIKDFKDLEIKWKRDPNSMNVQEQLKQIELRKDVAKKFVIKWVSSLIEELGALTPAGLTKLTDVNHKMTWWRWSKGLTIPLYETNQQLNLKLLLNIKVKNCEKNPHYNGKSLREIPTIPKLEELRELIKYI